MMSSDPSNMSSDPNHTGDRPEGVSGDIAIHRLTGPNQPPQKAVDRVVIEQAVTIMIEDVGNFTILCTPTDVEALAVGFVFAEGIIDGMDDVDGLRCSADEPGVVAMRVEDPSRVVGKRNLIVSSSCGLCGARNVERLLAGTPACGRTLRVRPEVPAGAIERMQQRQQVFGATGGAHAAAVFDADGSIVSLAEDIGRHSALDKAVGKCLLGRRPTAGCGVALSGRVSLEMVAKAARAGIELIAAVSAPSSLAIEAARHWNITLCGFVRSGRGNVYTCPERIDGLPV